MAITQQQVIDFCPSFRFHPKEQNFPCSIEYLCNNSTLKSKNDPNMSTPLTSDNCQSVLNNPDYAESSAKDIFYIQVNKSNYPGEVSGSSITAPIYYAISEYVPFTDINYLILSAFQDGQTMVLTHIVTEPFLVRKYGQHQGDLERVIVRIDNKTQTIIGIAFEAHGDVFWYHKAQCQFEKDKDGNDTSHVIVCSALANHSSRNMPAGTHSSYFVDEDKTFASFGIYFNSYIDDTGYRWRPYESVPATKAVRQLGLDANNNPISNEKWSTYCGRLGQINRNNKFETATYISNGKDVDFGLLKQTIIDDIVGMLHKSALIGDGPTGPGDREWDRPPTTNIDSKWFTNDGNQWNGIHQVLSDLVTSMTTFGAASLGAKVMACDARHIDALAAAYYILDEPLEEAPTIASWKWTSTEGINAQLMTDALSGKQLPNGDTLDTQQIWATMTLFTNRNDGGNWAGNSIVFYPVLGQNSAASVGALNKSGWQYQPYSSGGSGSNGIYDVVRDLEAGLNSLGGCSVSAKVAADDRRHGDARGFMFWNPTVTSADIEIMTNATGWGLQYWDSRNAADPTYPQNIVDVLNGGPLPDGTILSWAQVCSTRVLFTNRQEGDGDGATFILIYPLEQ